MGYRLVFKILWKLKSPGPSAVLPGFISGHATVSWFRGKMPQGFLVMRTTRARNKPQGWWERPINIRAMVPLPFCSCWPFGPERQLNLFIFDPTRRCVWGSTGKPAIHHAAVLRLCSFETATHLPPPIFSGASLFIFLPTQEQWWEGPAMALLSS